MTIFIPVLLLYNSSQHIVFEPPSAHIESSPNVCVIDPASPDTCLNYGSKVEVVRPREDLQQHWRRVAVASAPAQKGVARHSGLRDLLWKIPLHQWLEPTSEIPELVLYQQDELTAASEHLARVRKVERSDASLSSSALTASVRIFFNAGWRLSFDVLIDNSWATSAVPSVDGLDPHVALKMGDCDGIADSLAFRVMRPVSVERECVCKSSTDSRLYVCPLPPYHPCRGFRLRFAQRVNHLFEDDNYAEWRDYYAQFAENYPPSPPEKFGASMLPFHRTPLQLSLRACYYDSRSTPRGEALGLVNFALVPADGMEFVLFSLIGLVGVPVLLMSGFQITASGHDQLRKDVVSCIVRDPLFAERLKDYLNGGQPSDTESSSSDDEATLLAKNREEASLEDAQSRSLRLDR